MEKIAVGNSGFGASEIALGCKRVTALSDRDAERLAGPALEADVAFFGHERGAPPGELQSG